VLRTDVISEMREVEKDLAAFNEARSLLLRRADDMNPARRDVFLQWAVTQIILNSFVIASVRCGGLLEDYHRFLCSEELPDNVVRLERVKTDE
jgi:hypothetical protein